jgi:hypothetical protein
MTSAAGELSEAGGAIAPLSISGLVAKTGELRPGEALMDRIFVTVRAALDAAGLERGDVDAVLIAADDVADGRTITTMIHATAAGAYLKDELRVTQGGLTALGIAGLRVAAGLSRRAIVAAWWETTADPAAVARAATDVRDGSRALTSPDALEFGPASGACVACVVGPAGESDLQLEAFSFGQAAYREWIARDGEPEGVQRRLGADLARRSAPIGASGRAAVSRTESGWGEAERAAGVTDWRKLELAPVHHGLADGMVVLTRLAEALDPGERGIVFATGSPFFLQVEGCVVRKLDA